MVRPRKGESKEEIVKILEDHYDEIVIGSKIIGPANGIWEEIKSKHNVRLTSKAIYTEALKWLSSREEEKETESDGSAEEGESIKVNMSQVQVIKFSVRINVRVWNQIKPIQKQYNRKGGKKRTYSVLPPGLWTYKIQQAISANHSEIPCSWKFKNGKVSSSGTVYLSISGKCHTCNAKLIGELEEKPSDESNDVKINFKAISVDLAKHALDDSPVMAVRSTDVSEMCKVKKPAVVIRRRMMRATASMFKKPKTPVVSTNAIRCRKYRARKQKKLHENPITATEMLKLTSEYGNTIQRIGSNPFFVIYCSPNQQLLYDTYRKKNGSSKVLYDATGSVVKNIGILEKMFNFNF